MAKKAGKVKKGTGNRGREAKKPDLTPQVSDLLRWYDKHRRVLPWRAGPGETPDPYRVWLSEIMLQQTTVATVGPYFLKFLARWPTLPSLAAASRDEVMQMWAGLGYYRRARLLHECAQKLCADYGGVFPCAESGLLALPGLGPYTAAAVAAIAFGQPANVVDGNVERVMSRVFAIQTPLPQGKKEMKAAAAPLVPQGRAGDYAQALMDLGAMICAPRAPRCDLCPWKDNCRARAAGIAESLPRRETKKPKPTRRAWAFVLTDAQGRLLMRRRPGQGLLADMLEIPGTPWTETAALPLAALVGQAPVRAEWQEIPGIVRHIFTHFTLETQVARAVLPRRGKRPADGFWIAPEDLKTQAVPSVMHKIIAHALKSL